MLGLLYSYQVINSEDSNSDATTATTSACCECVSDLEDSDNEITISALAYSECSPFLTNNSSSMN